MEADDGTRMLAMIYLANDVMQYTKKTTLDYVNAFAKYLGYAFQLMGKKAPQTKDPIFRLLNVWSRRQVFSESYVARLREEFLGTASPSEEGTPSPAQSSAAVSVPSAPLSQPLFSSSSSKEAVTNPREIASTTSSVHTTPSTTPTRALPKPRLITASSIPVVMEKLRRSLRVLGGMKVLSDGINKLIRTVDDAKRMDLSEIREEEKTQQILDDAEKTERNLVLITEYVAAHQSFREELQQSLAIFVGKQSNTLVQVEEDLDSCRKLLEKLETIQSKQKEGAVIFRKPKHPPSTSLHRGVGAPTAVHATTPPQPIGTKRSLSPTTPPLLSLSPSRTANAPIPGSKKPLFASLDSGGQLEDPNSVAGSTSASLWSRGATAEANFSDDDGLPSMGDILGPVRSGTAPLTAVASGSSAAAAGSASVVPSAVASSVSVGVGAGASVSLLDVHSNMDDEENGDGEDSVIRMGAGLSEAVKFDFEIPQAGESEQVQGKTIIAGREWDPLRGMWRDLADGNREEDWRDR